MIKSELGRGMIYAGDTPLLSTIEVEQTGPLQLTIKAGQLKTTGQARIVEDVIEENDDVQAALREGKAEKIGEGRMRVWLEDKAGKALKPVEAAIGVDQVIDFVPGLVEKHYLIELGKQDGQVGLLVREKRLGEFQFPQGPAGWEPLQVIVYPFILPGGADELPDVYVFSVLPGFPPGTGPDDWKMQKGSDELTT